MRFVRLFVTLIAGIFVAHILNSQVSIAAEASADDLLYLDLKDGRVVIQMLPELAPNHVKRIKDLVKQKFYDGIVWHRVMDGFMAQSGDPTGTGTGGSGQKIQAEFTSAPFVRGAVGMARSGDPDSGDSQFFIMLADNPGLNGNYTVWGKVIKGMEFVDKIKKAPAGSQSGMVSGPDKIISITLASDAPVEKEAK